MADSTGSMVGGGIPGTFGGPPSNPLDALPDGLRQMLLQQQQARAMALNQAQQQAAIQTIAANGVGQQQGYRPGFRPMIGGSNPWLLGPGLMGVP